MTAHDEVDGGLLADWPYVGRESTFTFARVEGRDTLRAGALNTDGLVSPGRRERLVDDMQRLDLDLAVLTETNLRNDHLKRLTLQPGIHGRFQVYSAGMAPGARRGQGVAILLRREYAKYVQWWRHVPGRAVALHLHSSAGALLVIGIYYPTGVGRRETDETRAISVALDEWRAKAGDAHLLVGGDFNGVPDPSRDRAHGRGTQRETPLLDRLLDQHALRDLWRERFPDTTGRYTHRKATAAGLSEARLDYFLASRGLDELVVGTGWHMQPHYPADDDLARETAATSDDLFGTDHRQRLRGQHDLVLVEFVADRIVPRARPTERHGDQEHRRPRYRCRGLPDKKWAAFAAATDRLPARLAALHEHAAQHGELGESSLASIAEAWTSIARHLLWAARETLPQQKATARPGGRAELSPAYLAIAALSRQLRHRRHRSVDGLAQAVDAIRRHHPAVPELQEELVLDGLGLDGAYRAVANLKTRIRHAEDRRQRDVLRQRIQAAVQKRIDRFHSDVRGTLVRVLERFRNRVTIDLVRVSPTHVVDRPAEVREETAAFFERSWFAQRNGQDPRPDAGPTAADANDQAGHAHLDGDGADGEGDWSDWYAPLPDVQTAWYADLMAPVEEDEFARSLAALPNGKAAGASGVVNEFLKRAGARMQVLLRAVLNACLARRDVPDSWKKSLICCIPKGEWTGDLTMVRPIALLETMRKLFSSILTKRLQRIIETHGILRGGNFGFTSGRRTTDFVHVLRATIDDSLLRRRGLEVLLLDVRRAYDSVSWISLQRSLERIRVPAAYIQLLRNIFDGRRSAVITTYGESREFHPACGLDQGEVNSPLLWLVFYDTLLCRLNRCGVGYTFAADPDCAEAPQPRVACGAFADDLTLVAQSRADLQRLTDLCASFFRLHDVAAHPGKTVHVVNRWAARAGTQRIRLSADESNLVHNVLDEHAPFRLLGAWLTLDGLPSRAMPKLLATGRGIAHLVRAKAINDDIARYIANTVLVPAVVHRASATPLSPAMVARIEATWLSVIRHKCELPRSAPSTLLHSPAAYGIRRLQDALDEHHVDDLFRRLSDPGTLGKAARAVADGVRQRLAYPGLPYAYPSDETRCRAVFAVHLIRRLHARNAAAWHADVPRRGDMPPEQVDLQTPLREVVPAGVYRTIQPALARMRAGIVGDVAVVDADSERQLRLRPYTSIARRRLPRGRPPRWYTNLQQAWPAVQRAVQAVREAEMERRARRRRRSGPTPTPFTQQQLHNITVDPDGRAFDWQQAPVPPDGSLCVYTDGSAKRKCGRQFGGYAAVVTACAAGEPRAVRVLSGKYRGPQCYAGLLEAMAAAHVLYALPLHTPLRICSDSENCLRWWRRFVTHRVPTARDHRRRAEAGKLFEWIAERVSERDRLGTPTELVWVRAHADCEENDLADEYAKRARKSNHQAVPTWTVQGVPTPETGYHLLVDGVDMVRHPARILRRQTRAHQDCALADTLNRRHGPANGDGPFRAPLRDMFRIGKPPPPPESKAVDLYAPPPDQPQPPRAFLARLAAGQLPTLSRQARWHRTHDLPVNCIRCEAGVEETWEHILLHCTATNHAQRDGIRRRCRQAVCDMAGPGELSIAMASHICRLDVLRDAALILLNQQPAGLQDALSQLRCPRLDKELAWLAYVYAARSLLYHEIWLPRCRAVRAALGPWRTRRRRDGARDQFPAPPPPGPRVYHPPPSYRRSDREVLDTAYLLEWVS